MFGSKMVINRRDALERSSNHTWSRIMPRSFADAKILALSPPSKRVSVDCRLIAVTSSPVGFEFRCTKVRPVLVEE